MLPLVLVLAFLLMPILEIVLVVQVGQAIGPWWTVGLLAAGGLLGGWIVRREGRRAWRDLQEILGRGRAPGREPADTALVLLGGMLLLLPGFATDLVGLAFVLPFTRPLVRRLLGAYVARRVHAAGVYPPGMGDPLGRFAVRDPFGAADATATPRGTVVRGEVIKDDDGGGSGEVDVRGTR
ncbi:membrane protein FxsA [Actinomadura rubrobrunea]|uniref:Membrane protein FxsA n=1 Tax=Actinomadura rubrobrunea TaxID=115335 RepID=A0A9W6PYV3_9ACTN|nr:FxsA family protein [Actinomadura rubrobrunea]GLW66367.1 membrane protein FxsA [Actinomadura rubrobrunea]